MKQNTTNDTFFIKEKLPGFCCENFAFLNGKTSFDPTKEWQLSKGWVQVWCSRGKVLEKAGIGGIYQEEVKEKDNFYCMSHFEVVVYPRNPHCPIFICLLNEREGKKGDKKIIFLTDLIHQSSTTPSNDITHFQKKIMNICDKYAVNYHQINKTLPRQSFAGKGAQVGVFSSYFSEKDIPFLLEIFNLSVKAVMELFDERKKEVGREDDYKEMNESRARLMEWIIADDPGVQIARQNGVSLEMIGAFSFPPMVKY
jgi:hypothetical protein